MNLQPLLEPRSVAIVGASTDPKKISGMILGFLQKSAYQGRVYAVNPRATNQPESSMRWFASVDELPEVVDLLVCVVPVALAFEPIEAAARRGVPCCLLMTGGFGEGRTGEVGQERLARLLRVCSESGMRIVGPNTVGMVNFRHGLPLTFADWYGRDNGCRGGVAIVTHSGSVGGLIFSSLQRQRIGVDYWLGLGNEASLDAADFIEHFARTEGMHTVVCYLEGVRDGRRFMQAAAAARERGLRVVVLLAGTRPESARSTRSHTGKRLSDGDVYRGVFAQLGVVQVSSLEELTYVMVLLRTNPGRLGARVGILSASGGACSVIADHVMEAGLELPELDASLQQQLNECIPEYGSSANPVDLSADVVARGDILHGALARLSQTRQVETWLAFGRPLVERYHSALADFAASASSAMVVSCGVPLPDAIAESLRDRGVPVLDDPQLCMRAIARLVRPAAMLRPSDGGAPAAENLRIDTWVDADFGPVVALALEDSGPRGARIVRSLPVTRDEALGALYELEAAEGVSALATADAVERVVALAATEVAHVR